MVKTHTVVSQCAVSGRRLGNYREYNSPEIVSVMEACGPLVSCRQPERICCANGLGYIQSTSSTAAMCSVIYLAMISIQVVQTAYHVWTDVCVRCYSPPKRTCSNHLSSLSSTIYPQFQAMSRGRSHQMPTRQCGLENRHHGSAPRPSFLTWLFL